MTVTVVGASGFIGQHVVSTLSDMVREIRAVDLTERSFPRDVEFVKVNILNFEGVTEALAQTDTVIHLAASNLQTSLKNPRFNVEGNVGGTMNVLEAARTNDVERIVFSSASSVYGIPQRIPVSEDHPCAPTTVYGASKVAAEHLVQVYERLYGIESIILRLTNVYGPGQLPSSRGLVPTIFSKILSGETVEIYGDGSQSRDFVFVGDVAHFFAGAVRSAVAGEIVNLGSGKDTSVLDVTRMCEKVSGKTADIAFKKRELGERKVFRADIAKLKRLFGEGPEVSIEEGLRETFRWFQRSNGTLPQRA